MRLASKVWFFTLASYLFIEATYAADVIPLSGGNFDTLVPKERIMLVNFCQPRVGFCRSLVEDFEAAASSLKQLENDVKLATVNCAEQSNLCQAQKVHFYPDLRVYRYGKWNAYNGTRKAGEIVDYMIKQSTPAYTAIISPNNNEIFTQTGKLVIVGYFNSSTSNSAIEFDAFAEGHRDDYTFGMVTDDTITSSIGVTQPAIVLYRTFDEPRIEYPNASIDHKYLSNWISELSVPVIDEFSTATLIDAYEKDKPLAYYFHDPSATSMERTAVVDIVRSVARKYQDRVTFVWADAAKYPEETARFKMDLGRPAFAISDTVMHLEHVYDQTKAVTGESLDDFLRQFVAGEFNPKDDVFTLSAAIFEEVVWDDKKDVFINFWSRFGSDSAAVEPVWAQLAERYSAIKEQLIIAKFEAKLGFPPPVVPLPYTYIFPVFAFKSAGTKKLMVYKGSRTLEAFVAFVEAHAKNTLVPSLAEPYPDQMEQPLRDVVKPWLDSVRSTFTLSDL